MSPPARAATEAPFVAALRAALPGAAATDLGLPPPPTGVAGLRRAAVLVLLGPGADGGGDVVLLERAADMRSHPGQVAFPGGRLDAVDGGDPVRAALREAAEEVQLDAAGVQVLGTGPDLFLPPSQHLVTPVVAWEAVPGALGAGDPAEVARVLRVPLPRLAEPATRASVRAAGGWVGPAFLLDDLLVWGFTAVLLSGVLRLAGLERPWDAGRVVPLADRFAGSGAAPAPPVLPSGGPR